MTPNRWLTPREEALLKATILVAVGLWIFFPAVNGDWIWDDTTLYKPLFRLRPADTMRQGQQHIRLRQ
jgi:hypothetical protein